MVSIEQVKLLESRIIKAIEFIDQVTDENALLKSKFESCQKRVDELEVLLQRFKEDQAKIEDGIVSALDRLNKFEDDMDKGGAKPHAEAAPPPPAPSPAPPPAEPAGVGSGGEGDGGGFVLKEKPYVPDEEGEESGETPAAAAELDIF